jgi:glycosyltransferase involved in cell wall biosynthesis
MARVSIIVPVYKVEKYLDKCVESLINQTYKDLEIILVDDGSPDNCGELCDAWAKKDERIVVYHKENGGLSDARNYGIDRCTGECIAFVDSDDYVAENYIEFMYKLFDESDNCSVTACDICAVRNGAEAPYSDFKGSVVFSRREAFERVLYHDLIDVAAYAKLYKREVFDDIRYPVGRVYEDTYVFGDILNKTDHIVFGGEALYYYVQRDDSIVNGAFSEKRLQYIDSVERLVKAAEECDPELKEGCIRRLSHAYFSVLRYMDKCDKEFYPLRKDLRNKILETADSVLSNPKTPQRDKLAIMSLKFGLKPFFWAWALYGKIR